MKTHRSLAILIITTLLPIALFAARAAEPDSLGVHAGAAAIAEPTPLAAISEVETAPLLAEAGEFHSLAYLAYGTALLFAYHRRAFHWRRPAARSLWHGGLNERPRPAAV